MNSDDYARKQSAKDAEYERQYEAWVQSMTLEERREAERMGLLKPCLQRHGNGSPDHDIADSPAASHTPDMAALVDHEEDARQTGIEAGMREANRILRHLVADLLDEDNTRLTVECLAIALGLSAYNGDSMTDIAQRCGVTRAAVSKRCVDITNRLKVLPSRAMRSVKARRVYRKAQIKQHLRNNP
jgi:hypothetical protein